MVFRELQCSLHVCAAARGPEIKDIDEDMLVLAVTTIIPQLS